MASKNKKELNKQDSVIIYKDGKDIRLDVKFEKETVWLTQKQIAQLYGKERSVVTKHINAILADREVDEKSNVQKMHIANSDKPVVLYSLDVILAVGYRTNSARAIEFRCWSTKILKQYLLQGYVINERRLSEVTDKFKELQSAVAFLQAKSKKDRLSGQEGEILDLLASYAKTLTILDEYDKGELREAKGAKGKFVLTYEECVRVLNEVKRELITKKEAGDLFGSERGGSFAGIIKGLYQTFSGKELYQTLESKAAHLLYLVIKDHPFSDGNKRSASFLFVYFLDKNNALYRDGGEKKINDNTLTALALLVAESNPAEKDQIVALITQLLK